MKQQVVCIHGAGSFSDYQNFLASLRSQPLPPPTLEQPKRWRHTLAEDLGENYEVLLPAMPNRENAKYEEWRIWFDRHLELLGDGVVLVGHSQGGYFLSKYLVENDFPVAIKALCLVSAPVEPVDFNGEDGGDFHFDISKLPNIAHKTEHIHIFHSEDDFVVPFSHAEAYQAALPKATLHRFTDRGHCMQSEFPELLAVIRGV